MLTTSKGYLADAHKALATLERQRIELIIQDIQRCVDPLQHYKNEAVGSISQEKQGFIIL
jgi:hypothetical protein